MSARQLDVLGRAALLTLIACGVTPPLAAQEPELLPPPGIGSVNLGSFQVAPHVTLGHAGLDTNVFRTRRAESDTTLTFTPEALAWWQMRGARLVADGSVDFVYFEAHPTERSIDTRQRAELRLPFRRFRLLATIRSQNLRQQVGDEVDVRARRRETLGRLAGEAHVASRMTLGAEWLRARNAFSANQPEEAQNLRELLQRRVDRTTAYARYQLSPVTRLLARVEKEQTTVDFASARDARAHRVEGGILLGVDGPLRGQVTVGRASVDFAGSDITDFAGLVASGDIQAIVFDSTSLGVRVWRDLDYSSRKSQPYFVRTHVGGSILHRFDERWETGCSLTRAILDYRGSAAHDQPLGTSERIWTMTARLGLRLSAVARLGVDAVVDLRRSRLDPGREYGRFRLTTSMTYGFD